MTLPEVGVSSPMIMAMVVVLPAPLPPSSPVIEPGAMRKRHAIDRRRVPVDFDEAVDFYGGRGWHGPRRCGVYAANGGKGLRVEATFIP